MSVLTRFLGRLFGRQSLPSKRERAETIQRAQRRGPVNKYDAAQTTDENKNHWANTDTLSANAANSLDVRTKLRTRSRYERANNGYVAGIIRARTNDTIGTGPRLQLDLPTVTFDPDFQRPVATGTPDAKPADLARQIEDLWNDWCQETNLTDKLRVLADAEDTDGEGFGLFVNNPKLENVQLDVRVIECDRVTSPLLTMQTPKIIDGIILDDLGNPVTYHVLEQHPGDFARVYVNVWAFNQVPARNVIHLFEQLRPEQARGMPILTPTLQLPPILRRYTLASLGSAELGASIAGVIENPNGPPGTGDDPPEIEEMDQIPFARNALLTLGAGQTAKAFDSKNPNTGYKEFKGEILTEVGRAAGENRNTSTGSSAEYNYSSGRLDHLPRQRGIRIRRERIERKALDRIFSRWVEEAQTIPDYLPAGLPPFAEWRWRWGWDGFPSIDPKKDAEANQILKSNGLVTDAEALAERGADWREHYRQLAAEKQLRIQLGIDQAAPPPPLAPDIVPEDQGVPSDA